MKHIFYSLFLLALFSSCSTSTEPSAPQDAPAVDSSKTTAAYICPCGHCGYEGGNEPGPCPKCGMELESSKK